MFNSTSVYLDDKSGDDLIEVSGAVIEAASAQAGLDYFLGPTRWMYSADGITWRLATDSIAYSGYNDTVCAYTALYAPSLQRN